MPDSHHPGGASPDGAATAESATAYRFTFGHYTQADDWKDVRHLTWRDTAGLLTNHRIGPKEGTCVVPAVFRGISSGNAGPIQVLLVETTRAIEPPLQHLDQTALARRWRISPRSLERWRWLKQGPSYLKVGGKVLYRITDIEAYEQAQLRQAGA